MNHVETPQNLEGGYRAQMIGDQEISSVELTSDCDLRKSYKLCSTAMNILADIIVGDFSKGRPNPTLVRVGHVSERGIRTTAWILGPMRVDGGLLLLTQTAKGDCLSHRVCLLDDVYDELDFNRGGAERASALWALIEKAIRKRDRILSGTTNYFSGTTGKVVKIL
jgi:hypothetical protein